MDWETEMKAAFEALQIARKHLRHAGEHAFADACDDLASDVQDRLTDSDAYDGDYMTDAEADADTLASAGMGTDEDYGYYGGGDE